MVVQDRAGMLWAIHEGEPEPDRKRAPGPEKEQIRTPVGGNCAITHGPAVSVTPPSRWARD
jgi:hypothetical protein